MRRFLWVCAVALAAASPVEADVELPDDDPPRRAETFDRDDPEPEHIDGPPPRMHRHGLMQGAQAGPYPRFGVDVEVMKARMEGFFEYESAGGSGNELEIDEELPLEEHAPAGELRAWIKLADMFTLTAAYFNTVFEGKGVVDEGFTHDATRFVAGSLVAVEAEIELAWIGARFVPLDTEHVRFGLPFGAVWVSETLTIRDLLGGPRADGQIDVWSPYVGLWLDIFGSHGLGIEGELRLFGWGDEIEELFGYADARAQAYVTIADHIRIFGGARALAAEYLNRGTNDRYLNFELDGFFGGLSIYF